MDNREIISLHIGQAGIQIGNAFWELLKFEHELTDDGQAICYCPWPLQDNTSSLYTEIGDSHFKPRALFVDSESMVIDELKTGIGKCMFDSRCLINGLEDSSNVFSKGYTTCAGDVMENVENMLRSQLENSKMLNGFLIFHSLGGGTGSGLTARIAEFILEEAPKGPMIHVNISPPSEKMGFIVEPYNSLLAIAGLTETSSLMFTMENNALYRTSGRIFHRNNKLKFVNINRRIAQISSSLTTAYRFNNKLSSDFGIYQTNLVPYPGISFPIVSYNPSYTTTDRNLVEMTRGCFELSNLTVNVNPKAISYFASCLLYRGMDCNPMIINKAVQLIRKDTNIRFADWSPTGFKVAINVQMPGFVPCSDSENVKRSLCTLSNMSAISEVWRNTLDKFHILYSRKAYLHWFLDEGMDKETFNVAESKLSDIIMKYEDLSKTDSKTHSKYFQANHKPKSTPMKTIPKTKKEVKPPTKVNSKSRTYKGVPGFFNKNPKSNFSKSDPSKTHTKLKKDETATNSKITTSGFSEKSPSEGEGNYDEEYDEEEKETKGGKGRGGSIDESGTEKNSGERENKGKDKSENEDDDDYEDEEDEDEDEDDEEETTLSTLKSKNRKQNSNKSDIVDQSSILSPFSSSSATIIAKNDLKNLEQTTKKRSVKKEGIKKGDTELSEDSESDSNSNSGSESDSNSESESKTTTSASTVKLSKNKNAIVKSFGKSKKFKKFDNKNKNFFKSSLSETIPSSISELTTGSINMSTASLSFSSVLRKNVLKSHNKSYMSNDKITVYENTDVARKFLSKFHRIHSILNITALPTDFMCGDFDHLSCFNIPMHQLRNMSLFGADIVDSTKLVVDKVNVLSAPDMEQLKTSVQPISMNKLNEEVSECLSSSMSTVLSLDPDTYTADSTFLSISTLKFNEDSLLFPTTQKQNVLVGQGDMSMSHSSANEKRCFMKQINIYKKITNLFKSNPKAVTSTEILNRKIELNRTATFKKHFKSPEIMRKLLGLKKANNSIENLSVSSSKSKESMMDSLIRQYVNNLIHDE